MALLCTILFTREWIGDAVPILVVPIAALAFTPLGGYVAGKVNEQQQPRSQRYRPPQQYQQGNGTHGTHSEWQAMSGRVQAETNEASHVSRVARQKSISDYEWGASQHEPVPLGTHQPEPDEQGWGEGSAVPVNSTSATREPHSHPISSLPQDAHAQYQPHEVSSDFLSLRSSMVISLASIDVLQARKKSPLRQAGSNKASGLTSAACRSPFAEQSQHHTADAASTGPSDRSTTSTDRATQTEPQRSATASSAHPQKPRAGWVTSQTRGQGHEHSHPQEAQQQQTMHAIDEMATAVAEVTEAAATAAKPASDVVQAAARAASMTKVVTQPVAAGTAAARAVADSTAGRKATWAAQAAAETAAAAAASPAAAAASTFAAVSAAAAATAQSAAKVADSAHQQLNEVLSDPVSHTKGPSRRDKAAVRSSASQPLVTAQRQECHVATTVAESTEVYQGSNSGAASSAQQAVASQEHASATSIASQSQSSSSATNSGYRGPQGANRRGHQDRLTAEGSVHAAAAQSTNSSANDRHRGESQGEPEVVEAVEVLLPDDYEYLQRQRQRLQRRKQAPRARQERNWDGQQRRSTSEYTSEPRQQPAWWAGAGTSPSVRSTGVDEPFARSHPGRSRSASYAEGVRQRAQRGRSTCQPVSVRAGASDGLQGWGTVDVVSKGVPPSSRRMTARDLAAAHEHGRMSRFDGWNGGLSSMGPVAGLVQWMFGARARARVRDTVGASRRPLMGALMRVFPFLRSWGGFM